MESVIQDLKFAVRMLTRSKAFTAFTVVILALGIGANTALFSVVNAVILRPLDYPEPQQLVEIRSDGDGEDFPVSLPNFADWERQTTLFQAMAAYTRSDVNLTGWGDAERATAVFATDRFFDVLRSPALLGRTWSASDPDDRGVLLSEGIWRRRYGSDASLPGKTIAIAGAPQVVLGVMPAHFRFGDADLWVRMPPQPQARRSNFNARAVGRLKAGVSIEAAQAQMDAIGRRLLEQYPQQAAAARLESLRQSLVGDLKRPLFVLLGAVGLVLLVACVNVASLLLARADVRRRELAVRTSLGAARSRLIRQLLTEACLLSVSAGVLGSVLAVWGSEALIALLPDALPRAEEIGINGTVLLFALGISLFTGLLFGIAPALRTARGSLLAEMLEAGRATTAGARGRRTRRALVVAEVALALIPLVGAGLLLRSFQRLVSVDPGFAPEQVLTASYSLPRAVYDSPARLAGYADALIERVALLPGVQSVGITSTPLLSADNSSGSFDVLGEPVRRGDDTRWSEMRAVSPGYFNAAGIQLLRGRGFVNTDRADAPMVALVDEAFVRQHFPSGDVIGKRIVMGFDPEHAREVVGVVGSVRHRNLSTPPEAHIYFPFAQQPLPFGGIFVRTRTAPQLLVPAIAAAARTVDRDVPLYDVRTLEQAVAASVARPRFNAILFTLFATCAVLIAALGIYAVLSYTVAERRREIGIRVALGARPVDVQRLIVGEGVWLTLGGITIGAAVSLAIGRVLSTMLYGVSAHDAGTLIGVSALLAAIALAACYLPARRAARLDPAATLTD